MWESRLSTATPWVGGTSLLLPMRPDTLGWCPPSRWALARVLTLWWGVRGHLATAGEGGRPDLQVVSMGTMAGEPLTAWVAGGAWFPTGSSDSATEGVGQLGMALLHSLLWLHLWSGVGGEWSPSRRVLPGQAAPFLALLERAGFPWDNFGLSPGGQPLHDLVLETGGKRRPGNSHWVVPGSQGPWRVCCLLSSLQSPYVHFT